MHQLVSEEERLKRVYEDYQSSRSVQQRWRDDNSGNAWILKERSDVTGRLLLDRGLVPMGGKSVLEIGCGTGKVIHMLMSLGATPENLYGLDLLEDRVRDAARRYPGCHFECGNAEALRFSDNQFDILVFFTVFSSILDPGMRKNVAKEAARVLKPGGGVLWYDFRYNNPRNPHVQGMKRSDIRQLFDGFDIQVESITLLPPLARRLGRYTQSLYPLLSKMPFLQTHLIGFLLKPVQDERIESHKNLRDCPLPE